MFLLLHEWRYCVAGLLLAAALAHPGQIATDHFHNRLSSWGYYLIYRAWAVFDVARIAPDHNVLDSCRPWAQMVPFDERISPWYQRNIELWFHSRTHV